LTHPPPSDLKALASRLLAYERNSDPPKSPTEATTFRVCARLGTALSALTGVAGFRALLDRATVLAAADLPWFASLRVHTDGSIERASDVAHLSSEESAVGEAVLIAHLLGLLEVFIGGDLTVHLIRDLWPEEAFDDPQTMRPRKYT
jgi:hypothetical protein